MSICNIRNERGKFMFVVKQMIKMFLQHIILPAVYNFWRLVYGGKNPDLIIFADAHHKSLPFSMEYIHRALEEKGYEIDASDLKNFKVSCSSGHDYLGLWPNSSYNVTFKCYIQKKGESYRLKITCSLNPGSDQHGNYQGFW